MVDMAFWVFINKPNNYNGVTVYSVEMVLI